MVRRGVSLLATASITSSQKPVWIRKRALFKPPLQFGGNLLKLGSFMYRNNKFFILLAGEPEQAMANVPPENTVAMSDAISQFNNNSP
jgi:hypothetical protein